MSNKKPILGILSSKHYYKFLEDEINLEGGMSLNELEKRSKQRMNNLKQTIDRFLKENESIDIEWILEYNSLTRKLNNK